MRPATDSHGSVTEKHNPGGLRAEAIRGVHVQGKPIVFDITSHSHLSTLRTRLTAERLTDLLFVTASICPHAGAWIDQTSTVLSVIAQRPVP